MPLKKRRKGWRSCKPYCNKRFKSDTQKLPLPISHKAFDFIPADPSLLKEQEAKDHTICTITFDLDQNTQSIDSISEHIHVQEANIQIDTEDVGNKINKQEFTKNTQIPVVSDKVERTSESEDVLNDFRQIIPTLKENGVYEVFQQFFKLIIMKKWNFRNIAFLLWCDVVNFLTCENTSCMRYQFDETKKFWWLGKTLFHGRFERLMKGFKNEGVVIEGGSKGYYESECDSINFAVPSKLDSPVPNLKNYGPGMFDETIKISAEKHQGVSCVLTFDGKKLAPGLTENDGDIDLMGCEEGPTVTERKTELLVMLEAVEVLTRQLSTNGFVLTQYEHSTDLIKRLRNIIGILSEKTRAIQIEKKKKEKMLDSFKERQTNEKGKNYSYVIDSLRCHIQRTEDCYKSALHMIGQLCQVICALHGNSSQYSAQNTIDLRSQENLILLKFPEEIKNCFGKTGIPSELIKQRTPEWHDIRKKAKVTGSTLHKAVGGESLKAQRELFDETFGYRQREASRSEDIHVQRCIDHGVSNEINALATFVNIIMPTLYPHHVFYEEGAYLVKSKTDEILWEVSPDGTARDQEGNIKLVVEFKCPLPMYKYGNSVFYEVPLRHILQLQSQMKATNCSEALLVSWSEESTTVFSVPCSKQLQDLAEEETVRVFDEEIKRRPTRYSDTARKIQQELKTVREKCIFLGEFPSNKGILRQMEQSQDNSLRLYPVVQIKSRKQITTDIALRALSKAKEVITDSFQLSRQKATEFLPFLLTTADRHFNPETGTAIPLGYILRGYSLSSNTMRTIAETFHNNCHENGLHIPVKTFDGQWINLVHRGSEGQPLTEMQFAKDIHKEISKMDKSSILKRIAQYFTSSNCKKRIEIMKRLRASLSKMSHNSNTEDISLETAAPSEEDSMFVSQSCHTDEAYDIEVVNEKSVVASDQNMSKPGVDHEKSSTEIQHLNLSEDMCSEILVVLQNGKRGIQWSSSATRDIFRIFHSKSEMQKLMLYELKEIVRFLDRYCSRRLKVTGSKAVLVELLCHLFSVDDTLRLPEYVHKVPSLESICNKLLQKAPFRKPVLVNCLATMTYQEKVNDWREEGTINPNLPVFGLEETLTPWYIPEVSKTRDGIDVSVLDGTHLRTNLRATICRDSIKGVRRDAWEFVAKKGTTPLKPVMIEFQSDGKVLDQQNDDYQRTMFSEKVEKEMLEEKTEGGRNSKYEKEAYFCRCVREWNDAEDTPGIPAVERCRMALNFRKWLLSDVDFGIFPTYGNYIKGIPRVTYEGILCNVEAHLYLYNLCKNGTYNWRSISSLSAETFMSEVDYMDNYARNGVLTAHGARMHINNAYKIHALQHDPKRNFNMRIADSPVYRSAQYDESNGTCSIHDEIDHSIKYIDKIVPRDHFFDSKQRMRYHTVKPVGTISGNDDVCRGVLPVRARYKVDESKILPSKRQ